jgi:hypothetical protein
MFERFTLDGREAVAAAAQAAHEAGVEIGPGQLLLGVLRASSPASGVLEKRGATVEGLRDPIATDSHPAAPDGRAPRFSAQAERAMALASGDAGVPVDALALLVGLLREESGRALALLGAAGVDADGLEEAALAAREEALAAAPALDAAPELAIRMAFDEGREVDGGDLLLALAQRDAITQAALAELGVGGDALHGAVRAARGA